MSESLIPRIGREKPPKRNIVLASLLLLQSHSTAEHGAVWSHDIYRLHKETETNRRLIVAQPSILATLNALDDQGLASGHFEMLRPDAGIPRKFHRLEPEGELEAVLAIDAMQSMAVRPAWLPEQGQPLRVSLPHGFTFTEPRGPLD